MKTFRIRSTSDLPEVAEAILDARAGRTVIAFRGGMGAGKTTLIDRIEEAFDFGYEEYFFSGNLCLVEWPEKIESLLPDDAMNVRIDVPDEDERVISID